MSARQREVISEASEATEKDMSAFVFDAALMRAQAVLADWRIFALDQARYQEFVAVLDRPVTSPPSKPRLGSSYTNRLVLEQ